MKNINPTSTKSWKLLKKHFFQIKKTKIIDLFHKDKNRFDHFSRTFNYEILVDYSKNLITSETMIKLISLAKECDLSGAISAMFHGEKINHNENCAVLHTALRNKKNTPILIDGNNIMPKINTMLKKMKKFCKHITQGNWTGYTNKTITDIVNIGIGGSNLGPYMVTEALKPYKNNNLNIHFISNVDGTQLYEKLKYLNPETTLFLIASKSFTTQETITNANSARNWFYNTAFSKKKDLSRHFIALSTNPIAVKKFGINPSKNMFELWNWVGGRYSLWSSIGLPIMLSIGEENFEKLLNGAHDMDQHFYHTAFENNIPVILALIGIWYNNFFYAETEAILPYDQYMHQFPTYLQQSNMESNGKNVDRNGHNIKYQTGPIIWGGTGTDGQHSFYQLIHQGTKMIPCDFIAPVISHHPISDHHEKLIANFLAQTKALAFGKTYIEVIKELKNLGQLYHIKQSHTIPFKIFRGNNPSNSILLKKITPYTLGALIALYEHKIFTQGIILNIYTFDQWGVELGKQLADQILIKLKKENNINSYDSSTNGLINTYKHWKSK